MAACVVKMCFVPRLIKLGYLYFPAPGPLLGPRCCPWPPAPAPSPGPQFVFTGPGPKFVFNSPSPKFVFNDPGPQFVFTGPDSKLLFTGLGQSEAWACRYQLCSPNLYLLALAYDFYYRALNLYLPSYL